MAHVRKPQTPAAMDNGSASASIGKIHADCFFAKPRTRIFGVCGDGVFVLVQPATCRGRSPFHTLGIGASYCLVV